MQIYLAPLQGLTDRIFRESYAEHIGSFDKTYAPFIRVQQGQFYRVQQCNDILPENNRFQKPVPQFLGNDVVSFRVFEKLCIENGYDEVNINMGCPFPMVTGRQMGAGILSNPAMVEQLLEGVFGQTRLRISVKCRLGQNDPSEFEPLIDIFNAFPLEEIIIHPRIGKQQYKGGLYTDDFARFVPELKVPVCYNGDILCVSDVEKLNALFPVIQRIMIGRGILINPFLPAEIRGQQLTRNDKIRLLHNFHLRFIDYCRNKYSGDAHVLKRLEEFWTYHALGFEDGHKILKQIKKCKSLSGYEALVYDAVNQIK